MRARSGLAELLGEPGMEATFVAADPPRASWLAIWHPSKMLPSADTDLELVQPVDGRMQQVTARVTKVPVADAIEVLVRQPAESPAGESIRLFATASRLAMQLISRGRLQPSLTPFGIDTWRLGPLDPPDVARQHQLVEAMPATAHSLPLGNTEPLRIMSAAGTVEDFGHAVVDAFARTTAAPIAAGHAAFAATRPVTIDARAALESFAALAQDNRPPLTTLRLTPPDTDAEPFVATLAFQSRRDSDLTVTAASLWNAPDNIRARLRQAETNLLIILRRAAQVWPPLSRLLEQARPTDLVLDDDEVDELLGPIANRLGAVGLSILAPADLFRSIDLTPIVTSPAPTSLTGRGLDLASLLELRWQGSVDGIELTAHELDALSTAKRSVIRLRGQWVRVDANHLRRLDERQSVGASSAVAAAMGAPISIGGEYHTVEMAGPLAELGDRLRILDTNHSLPAPAALKGELRPYQERGLAWLSEMDGLGLGGILADDMGLGKTVQIIALMLLRRSDDNAPSLVVCPASVVGNWEREIHRFAPDIEVRRYHGPLRRLGQVTPGSVVLTTYGVARRDASLLSEVPWGLTIADEAQAIKNPYSRTARAMRSIPSQTRFALTGTPVQNQLTDLWAILDWTTPGLLGPLERFRQDIAIPVERERDEMATDQLNRILRPFLLRRRKTDPDIAPDLPPKTETDEVVPLTVEQAALYRAVVDEVMDEIATADGINRRGLVLKLVTQLKQVCNHPAQLVPDAEPLADRSGKLTRATELLEIIRDEGDASLLFTQYVTMGHLLDAHLSDLGFRTHFLHGSLSLTQREDLVSSFQDGGADVFIISLRAGGIGLNLTAATHVIHYDRWWNPAVEDQASDRAWRIGQDRPVQIHRLICEGTIEDRIAALLNEKRQLADSVVGSGEGWISELNDAALAELVALSDEGPSF